MDAPGELAYAEDAVGATTTSSVVVDGLTVTVEVGDQPVLVSWEGFVSNDTPSAGAYLDVHVDEDGTRSGRIGSAQPGTTPTWVSGFRRLALPAGTHVIQVRLACLSGRATLLAAEANPAALRVVQVDAR